MSLALISQSYLSDSDLDCDLGGGEGDVVVQNHGRKHFESAAGGNKTGGVRQNLRPINPKVEAGVEDKLNANEIDGDMTEQKFVTKTNKLSPPPMSASISRKRGRPTLVGERYSRRRKPLAEVKLKVGREQKAENVTGAGPEKKVVQYYTCPVCLLVCKTGNELIQHLGIHMEYRDKANDKTSFRKTIKISKDKRGPRRNIQSMGRHKLNQLIKCNLCSATFRFPVQLSRHMMYHDSSRNWKCSHCTYYFSTRGRLKNHEKRNHGVKTEIKLEQEDLVDFQPKYVKPGRPKVGSSHRLSQIKKVKHDSSHQGDEGKIENDVSETPEDFNSSPNTCPKKIRGGRKRNALFPGVRPRSYSTKKRKRFQNMSGMLDMGFKCEMCDSAYPRSNQLTQHMRMHDKTRPLKCSHSQCNYYFLTSGRLLSHETRMHGDNCGTSGINQDTPNGSSRGDPNETENLTGWTEVRPFQIRSCRVVLTRCDNLLRTRDTSNGSNDSLRGVGSKSKLLMSQSLKMKQAGEEASRISNKEIEFINPKVPGKKVQRKRKLKSRSCPVCSKVFLSHGHAVIHLRVHTKEKPYQCPTCSKSFSQAGSLGRHMIMHTGEKPFRCQTCSRAFSYRSNMQKHMSIHTGVWRYRCPVCSKGFPQRSNLEFHIYTHTGQTPFKCPHCPRAYRVPLSLKCHIQNTHKN